MDIVTTTEDIVKDDEDLLVNAPTHYIRNGVECIDWIESVLTTEEFKGYLKAAILKYLFRYKDKGKPVMDLKKAENYLNRLISKIEEEES